MQPDVWRSALATIFKEAFEGMRTGESGTWFVERREALLPSVAEITAEQASAVIDGYPTTIGGQIWHTRYYLALFNATMRGEKLKADWPGSWTNTTYDDASWAELAESFATEYKIAADWYDGSALPDSDEIPTYVVSNVAHAAFHLGVVRALMPIVLSKTVAKR